MATTRTIISISEEMKKWVEGYSKAHKISMAEAIRKGISKLKKDEGKATYDRILEKTAGLWKGEEGLRYQKEIRSEWS